MKRDLAAFANRTFDILVIGGGIYGACIARDAALRGLSVALVEKSDFCSGTSHNSLKIIHSGIRYFQHLDFRRVRESTVERKTWLTIAPHLVQPLKFIIPTQGYLARGPIALQAAMVLHRLLGLDWNRGVPESSRIPMGRVHGRGALRNLIPGLPLDGLSGAASWHDGHLVEADRVVIECLQSAVANGAVVANYVSAESFLQSQDKVHGVVARDHVGNSELEIRADITINAAGPWIQKLLQQSLGRAAGEAVPPLARNMNIVTRQLLPGYGVGIPSKRPSDAVIGSENRLFFVTPWKGVSNIGTTHFPYNGDPDDYAVTDGEVDEFVDEINMSYPPAKLRAGDIYYVYSGLTPAEPKSGKSEVERSKQAAIIDHAARHNLDGLLSVVGVKYTTSRLVAERVVSLVQRRLGKPVSSAGVRNALLPGAIDHPRSAAGRPEGYGQAAARGIRDADSSPTTARFEQRVRDAVDCEMAMNLDDVLLRRNNLAARGLMTEALVRQAATIMSEKLGWNAAEANRRTGRMCESLRYLRAGGTVAAGIVTAADRK